MTCASTDLTGKILGCAVVVHKTLGPGLLESAYQRCLELELTHQGLAFEKERRLGLWYRGVLIPDVYRLDFLVEGCVVVEIKSVQKWEPVFEAQLLTYLRLTKCQVGLLLNFNVPTMREGIKRFVLNWPGQP